ncbi:similar to Saccharomyces cerevisiae YNL273W TOF1 Subunit of a replication-pausing checkpoint complex (Tof1p-Mrc1p-Csm3p) [Maudiozyma saulgeensis]|uniref:Topoisomerase 1-associated factor 1 n=1 Tax=Maudiozyma saulgeensis TaxID=1789683 RepID=A0A1X7R2K5_9SACH|nr:similar to Saccharomyces cerevisiae YNL273W TOF1 Subunit of a replication-pausing checkpoint complex (Tof1p-Mrc1p-Csm3p) [Kazachstania saulgeensis]
MSDVNPSIVLKARIALLSTSIGGPDYSSNETAPKYKLGDEALLCLKDLKRWFKLVDDEQNRLDVAMATAEYKILIDDLIPILIEWETKAAQHKTMGQGGTVGKTYYDKIALQCLQLMVLMTWPLILTDQSSISQVNNYAEVKKFQLTYKKAILSMEDGKVLKAIVRIVTNVMRIDRMQRTPHDNMIIKLALNFFRNVIAIEPGELTITNKKKTPKGINAVDTLPPGVSHDDISLNSVITSFNKNKVFKLLLTLSSSMTKEFDQDFINVPLLEIMTYLTKDMNQDFLIEPSHGNVNEISGTHKNDRLKSVYLSRPNMELTDLLKKETEMKKNLIKHTSSRHSRFGAMLSIQTPNGGRLTVSGGQNLLDESSAMDKIDARKKWNKRQLQKRQDPMEEGLPDGFLNSQRNAFPLIDSTSKVFVKFLNNFIDSSFNILLHSINNYFTTEQDKIVTLEQIEYLLFNAWFIKYQVKRCNEDPTADITMISETLNETSYILICQLLRNAFDMKNWPVVHASMIAFNELLLLLNDRTVQTNQKFDIQFILSRLFSDERIQLLSNLPRTAFRHSEHYMKTCIHLTHSVLKILEKNTANPFVIEGKNRRGAKTQNLSENDIKKLMEQHNIDRDVAIEILAPQNKEIEVDFTRVQGRFINDATLDTYINFLERFRELDHQSIKETISFFHRVLTKAKEETYLFRLDLIVLLRDILDSSYLAKNSRSRKYVEEFSDYLLYRLKKRLKVSPAWFVGLLFPSLHDSQIGYYQRYGEMRSTSTKNRFGVIPSTFKSIEDEETLPVAIVRDMKVGILVSTIIDNGDIEILELLKKNMEICFAFYDAALQISENTDTIPNGVEKETLTLTPESKKHLLTNKDFRALLVLLDYSIPHTENDKCVLNEGCKYSQLLTDLDSLKKYLTTPFEAPNGKSSSSYLIRTSEDTGSTYVDEDGWNGHDEYDYDDPSIVRDDDEYFKSLDQNMEDRLKGKKVARGLAKSKKFNRSKKPRSKRGRNNLPMFDVDDDSLDSQKPSTHSAFASKEYISDSDDEEEMSSVFYENEIYLRYLLEKYNKTLTSEQSSMYAKFRNERVSNNGNIINVNKYTELFGGSIPSLEELKNSSIGSTGPNMVLHNLSTKRMEDTFKSSDGNSDDDGSSNTQNGDTESIRKSTDNDHGSNEVDGDNNDDDEETDDNSKRPRNRKRKISEIESDSDDEVPGGAISNSDKPNVEDISGSTHMDESNITSRENMYDAIMKNIEENDQENY